MFNFSKKNWKQIDWMTLLVVIALCAYGLMVLRSATARLSSQDTMLRSQMIATGIGFAAILILQGIDTDFLKKLAIPIYILSVGLLLATLVFGYGEEAWGANSWLRLGPMQFQPSEFVKLGMIISAAAILDKHKSNINRPLTLLKVIVLLGLPIGLILLQPDFGTAMVFIVFLAVMIFTVGLHWGYIVGAIVAVLAALPIVHQFLSPTQQNRILDFIDPNRNPLGSGYQPQQGLIAIGSGELYGRGYMQGTQSQLGFIPEQQTDYIFAVLVEELGFVGGVALILLYGFLLFRLMMIARRAKDTFGSAVVIGIGAMLFAHIFENIGMTIRLMPVTGIPLPFMSVGGTFQLINLIAIGIALTISTQKKPLDFD